MNRHFKGTRSSVGEWKRWFMFFFFFKCMLVPNGFMVSLNVLSVINTHTHTHTHTHPSLTYQTETQCGISMKLCVVSCCKGSSERVHSNYTHTHTHKELSFISVILSRIKSRNKFGVRLEASSEHQVITMAAQLHPLIINNNYSLI